MSCKIKDCMRLQRNRNGYKTKPVIIASGSLEFIHEQSTKIERSGSGKVTFTLNVLSMGIDLQCVGVDGSVLFSLPEPLCFVVDFRVSTAILKCGALPADDRDAGDDGAGAVQPLQM